VAVAVGDTDGDGVVNAIALTLVNVATSLVEWPSPAAGMLASSSRMPAEKTTRDPRLIDLCSQQLQESQSAVRGSDTT
jgi:hypothetical protein